MDELKGLVHVSKETVCSGCRFFAIRIQRHEPRKNRSIEVTKSRIGRLDKSLKKRPWSPLGLRLHKGIRRSGILVFPKWRRAFFHKRVAHCAMTILNPSLPFHPLSTSFFIEVMKFVHSAGFISIATTGASCSPECMRSALKMFSSGLYMQEG